VTYTAYSALAVAHQAWGAKLGGSAVFRSRVVAWREGLGLLGVVLAAVSAAALGVVVMLALLGLGLGAGWWAWSHAPRPVMPDAFTAVHPMRTVAWWHPWRNRSFRRLMVVFLLNGIASSIPATLVLFFVQDRLQAGVAWQPAVLGIYFLCGALSIPLWLKGVCQLGLERTWLLGMVLSVIVFLGASLLGTGDELPFLAVCALSGAALGSDLAVPAALLAGVIANAGDNGHAEGAYFGWWNFAAKFNLALAAGLALPLLSWLGYAPGARDAEVLRVLTVAYCLLPCLLKVLSAAALYFLLIQPAVRPPIP
jgi:Na+/melibiose symporter-like transporter